MKVNREEYEKLFEYIMITTTNNKKPILNRQQQIRLLNVSAGLYGCNNDPALTLFDVFQLANIFYIKHKSNPERFNTRRYQYIRNSIRRDLRRAGNVPINVIDSAKYVQPERASIDEASRFGVNQAEEDWNRALDLQRIAEGSAGQEDQIKALLALGCSKIEIMGLAGISGRKLAKEKRDTLAQGVSEAPEILNRAKKFPLNHYANTYTHQKRIIQEHIDGFSNVDLAPRPLGLKNGPYTGKQPHNRICGYL
jgi:hypothetical protein